LLIKIDVAIADVVNFKADVLALKYAQKLYGVDNHVVDLLADAGVAEESLRPDLDKYSLTDSRGAIAASSVLLLGVRTLPEFGYQEIRKFSRTVLAALCAVAPETEHVCMTLHGANFGLDEVEAFQSEVAGLLEAVQDGDFPKGLRRVSIVEINRPRAERLDAALSELLPGRTLSPSPSLAGVSSAARHQLRSVGYASEGRPHVFVAMPFSADMHDTFHYGIQGAVRNAGYICERADLSTFTGDILDWVRRRIKTAQLLVADLTSANPNVYLEVGYAWGCEVPTILLSKESSELKFDVRGQRCILYKSIKDLEEKLTRELVELSDGGGV
jgi:hypothetical protein